MGYHLAGFDVVGIDIEPQPEYPFEFIQADALKFPLRGFDCYHASPPCQRYSLALNTGSKNRTDYPDLIPPIRNRLKSSGRPFVIENVVGSPLQNPRLLCGTRFLGLRVIRHRLFECSFWFRNLLCGNHPRVFHNKTRTPDLSADTNFCSVFGNANWKWLFENWKLAMQIPWVSYKNRLSLSQAIPPAYTRYIGKFLMDAVMGVRDFKEWKPEFVN
jgi:DNA (cytosine-5)-methyltransferase 1